jgi:hypothetical protein
MGLEGIMLARNPKFYVMWQRNAIDAHRLVLSTLGTAVADKFYEQVYYQRIGQAFMNALPKEYYDKLTGTECDPFHTDNYHGIYTALDYLTDPNE